MEETKQHRILTPDQRLRVFVSSTLNELAAERQAAESAIRRVNLTPVMFELGARPHPPRDLYRQYLAQSQIFVAIYWEKYGWVAPGENISGLEDEYRLATDFPKLIYIKKPVSGREPRLEQLIRDIQADDQASYKTFEEAEELEELIANDLAVLMTEAFINQLSSPPPKRVYQLPEPANKLVGREEETASLVKMLETPTIKLVTLVGAGGMGKTRLALEVGHKICRQFPDGACFISLESCDDPALVLDVIARQMGLQVGSGSLVESVKVFLSDKRLLLIIDNFEQVVSGAPVLTEILSAAPGVKILATSRELLKIRGEHVYQVLPLNIGQDNEIPKTESLPEAVQLFIERAKAANSEFEAAADNLSFIFKICKILEGLPLAIELAAARTRLFGPKLLLEKLSERRDVLSGGLRNLPTRHQTINNTIDWSYRLLSENEKRLLERLSLFEAGFSLEAGEKMATGLTEDPGVLLESLLDKSLIYRKIHNDEPRFFFLRSILEFSNEKLNANQNLDEVMALYGDYFFKIIQFRGTFLTKWPEWWFIWRETEYVNIRKAVFWWIEKRKMNILGEFFWNSWVSWWVHAHTSEAFRWAETTAEILEKENPPMDDICKARLWAACGVMAFWMKLPQAVGKYLARNFDFFFQVGDRELEASILLVLGITATSTGDLDKSDDYLARSYAICEAAGNIWGCTFALNGMARNSGARGNLDKALQLFTKSHDLAEKSANKIAMPIALNGLATVSIVKNDFEPMKQYLTKSYAICQEINFYEGFAWIAENLAGYSVKMQQIETGVKLLSAASRLREVMEFPLWADPFNSVERFKQQMITNLTPGDFEKYWSEGRGITLPQMHALVMQILKS